MSYVELIIKGEVNDGNYVYSFKKMTLKDAKEMYFILKTIIELQKEKNKFNLMSIVEQIAAEMANEHDDEDDIYNYIIEFLPYGVYELCHTLVSFEFRPYNSAFISYNELDDKPKIKNNWYSKIICEDDWLESIKKPIPKTVYKEHKINFKYLGKNILYYWADNDFIYCQVDELEDRDKFTHIVYFEK